MKHLLLLFLSLPSCAEFTGNSITGDYHAVIVMTDLGAFSQTSKKVVATKVNQSKVPLSAIRTAGTLGATAITTGALEAANANATAVDITNSNNAAAGVAAKEATKRLSIETNAATEALKIAKP